MVRCTSAIRFNRVPCFYNADLESFKTANPDIQTIVITKVDLAPSESVPFTFNCKDVHLY